MQFYIDQAEIDAARTLAERALTSIYYRYEFKIRFFPSDCDEFSI
jgi:ribosomal protein L16/L10AE